MSLAQTMAIKELLAVHDSGVWGRDDLEGGVSVLRSVNFQNDGSLDLRKLTFKAIDDHQRRTKRLQEGDILVEKSGGGPKQPVGRVCIFKRDAQEHVFGNFVARLRTRPDLCEPEYLFWYLWNFHRTGRTQGYQKQTTGIRNLEFKRYLDVPIPLPPLGEQRRIVDVLNRADGIRRLRREALDKARQLIPALFVATFGDPATNPKGWPITRLGEILSACDYGTSQKASTQPPGVPILRMGNVTYKGDLQLDDLKYIELIEKDLVKYSLEEGDILFNRTNSKDLVGKTGLWDGRFEAVAASYFIRLRVDLRRASPIYVWTFLNSSFMKRRLFETARGAIGQSNINSKELRSFPIPLPPSPLQREFASRVTELQAAIVQQKRMADASEQLLAALMARLFDGE